MALQPNDPGYLLGCELRESTVSLIITDTDPLGRPGLHREDCSYFIPITALRRVIPVLGELAFGTGQQRNRAGGPRTAYLCSRCMVPRARS